jgi:hypothetical protein
MAPATVLMVAMSTVVVWAMRTQLQMRFGDPEAYALTACVDELDALTKKIDAKPTPADIERRDSIEIYIAEHLRERVENPAEWARSFPAGSTAQKKHPLAAAAVARHPVRTPEQVKKADEIVAPLVASQTRMLTVLNAPLGRIAIGLAIFAGAGLIVVVLGVIGALAMRGGFTFRLFGSALVTAQGTEASRIRALLRTIVAWLPLGLLGLLLWLGPGPKRPTIAWTIAQMSAIALLAGGAAWAIARPARGIQDRVAGTWIVPR